MVKTRDRFKKIRAIKETFHAKMGTIKDRKGMSLTEAEDIKKRWQEYTELNKKDLFFFNFYYIFYLFIYLFILVILFIFYYFLILFNF